MNSNWLIFLGANGARIDGGIVSDFGDPDSELVAARDATIIAPLAHLGLLECAGEDARTFLQNQLTSDVNHLSGDAAQHSAWCSPKGRMLASFVLYRSETGYQALLSADLLEATQKRLQIYVFRSKVKISNRSGDYEMIGLSGPQAEAALAGASLPLPPEAMKTAAFAGGAVIRLDKTRFIIVVASEAAANAWQGLADHARPSGTPVWQWLDIQAGIPRIAEATKEAFVPQMVHFDKIGGVSFHKGCYPGQEVVARAKYLGKIKRHLYRFHTGAPTPAGISICPSGTPDQPCGLVANAAPAPGGGYDGLAVILEEHIGSGGLLLNLPGNPGIALAEIALVGG